MISEAHHNYDAKMYRAFVEYYSRILEIPEPKVYINKGREVGNTECPNHDVDSTDHFHDFDEVHICYSTPFWLWNAAHEFAHYVLYLRGKGMLTGGGEENFIEFFIDEPMHTNFREDL